MGSISQLTLISRNALIPDEAQEIGATPRFSIATACRVSPLGNVGNSLIFQSEVPIRILWSAKQEQLSSGKEFHWWRFEAKIDQTRVHNVNPRDYLVIAEYPYSIQRVHSCIFKAASRKSREERPSFARICDSSSELLEKIELLNVDYWERGSFLTAGLSKPNITMQPSEIQRQFQNTMFVLGICSNLHQCIDELLLNDQSRRLLKQTKDRTLKFWPKTAKLVDTPRLYDEVIEHSDEILFLSIQQALAGSLDDKWLGRPVIDLVDQIYRAHFNNLNRAISRRRMSQL